jgi:hypothetical protein
VFGIDYWAAKLGAARRARAEVKVAMVFIGDAPLLIEPVCTKGSNRG